MSGAIDVASLRADQFPVTREWAWFNHASFGPPPIVYMRAMAEFVEKMTQGRSPTGYELYGRMLEGVRAKAARFVGCEPSDVALLKGTAEALSVVALGLDWNEGDEVLVYDQAFPNAVYPWLNLAPRGVGVRFIRDRGRGRHDIADVEEAMTSRTRVVCLELVNFSNGFRAPIAQVGRVCRERGVLLLVDATQAAGALRIDVGELGCDALVAHGYKFLMSGWGTAIAYYSPQLRSALGVSEPGWKSVRDIHDISRSLVDYQLDFSEEARRFEPGVPDMVSITGMGAVIDLLMDLNTQVVEERVLAFAERVADAVAVRGWQQISARTEERSGILSVKREGTDTVAVRAALEARGVACSVREGRLRLSVHLYNDDSDLDRLLDALPA